AAAALYTGPLLEGLNCDGLEDWLRAERDLRRTRLGAVLRGLLAAQEARSALADALATADRLLALDPLDEAAHRAAMRLHAAGGAWGGSVSRPAGCCCRPSLGWSPRRRRCDSMTGCCAASRRPHRRRRPRRRPLQAMRSRRLPCCHLPS